MKRLPTLCAMTAALAIAPVLVEPVSAQYAVEIISYSTGLTPTAGFVTPSSALGSPERFTGEGSFPSVVSPFSPPFLPSEIVSIGEGGQITLRLSNYAIPLPKPTGPEIGIFSNFGIVDASYPNGVAGSPASGFSTEVDHARVEVSENGVDWTNLGSVASDIPSNGYTDLADPYSTLSGSFPSDFQQPFTRGLPSFDGLKYADTAGPDMLELFADSGGGKWIDISGSGLAKVGYVRLSVADDLLANTMLNYELDGVSIAHAALGEATVPEPAAVILEGLAVLSLAASLCPQRSLRD